MVVGMLTLAVPGSVNFAGEFAILAGVFTQGWGYAAVGAVAIVLAAMYTLRLISAVLHRGRGEAVRDESLDLRFGELALVVPLVAILLALSAWPASITERVFPGAPPVVVVGGFAVILAASIATPKVDWLALSPALALLAAAAVCLLGAVLVPAGGTAGLLRDGRRSRVRRRRRAGRRRVRPLARAAAADRRVDDA